MTRGVPLPRLGGVVPPPSEAAVNDEDYMNEDPEGIFHTYSNQKELLEQVLAYRTHSMYVVSLTHHHFLVQHSLKPALFLHYYIQCTFSLFT